LHTYIENQYFAYFDEDLSFLVTRGSTKVNNLFQQLVSPSLIRITKPLHKDTNGSVGRFPNTRDAVVQELEDKRDDHRKGCGGSEKGGQQRQL
jgi:hypothetical protein